MAIIDALNTGNSAIESTFGNEVVADDTKQVIAKQQHELAELLPSVQQIVTVLDDEIAAVSDIRAYISSLGTKATGDDIQAEYRARELYIGLITRLKESISDKVANAEAEANR